MRITMRRYARVSIHSIIKAAKPMKPIVRLTFPFKAALRSKSQASRVNPANSPVSSIKSRVKSGSPGRLAAAALAVLALLASSGPLHANVSGAGLPERVKWMYDESKWGLGHHYIVDGRFYMMRINGTEDWNYPPVA